MHSRRLHEVPRGPPRQYISLAVNVLVLLFVLFACMGTYRRWRSMSFELMPMTLNLLAMLLITFLCVTQENYEYNLVIYVVEIYTYFFFTFSFVVVLLGRKSQATKCTPR